MNNRTCLYIAVLLAGHFPAVMAQDRFELQVPGKQQSSLAVRTSSSLQVTGADRTITNYVRDGRFDSSDGAWIGYYSRAANQILRWPANDSGRMQIGTVRGSSIEYRTSQMTVHPASMASPRTSQRLVLPPDAPIGSPSNLPATSQLDALVPSDFFHQLDSIAVGREPPGGHMLRLASYDPSGRPRLLARSGGFELDSVAANSQDGVDWWVAPASAGYIRLETYQRGRLLAVSVSRRGPSLTLQPLGQDARQIWRIMRDRRHDRFVLANAHHSSLCLSILGNGQLALQPIGFLPTQLWRPYTVSSTLVYDPFWRSIAREIQANPPLQPAQLELTNSHRNALIVLLGDQRRGDQFETLRIEPGGSKTISLDRDAGSTILETTEVRSSAGVWDRQQLVTSIPPVPFYDLSVYEEHLQSIAIDRTGKSPNPIEDTNYVPKSVGWLQLPAGDGLPIRSQLDVYAQAREARNPGAVRKLDLKRWMEPPRTDPLESILDEFRSVPRRKF